MLFSTLGALVTLVNSLFIPVIRVDDLPLFSVINLWFLISHRRLSIRVIIALLGTSDYSTTLRGPYQVAYEGIVYIDSSIRSA